MQMVTQQVPETASRPISREAKSPRWLQWMTMSRPNQISSIQKESGGALDIKGRCPDLYHVSHISWSPDQKHVSFVGNNRYVWLLSAQGKHTELLVMLPEQVGNSLTNAWSADAARFHISYMHDNQLTDYEFDLQTRTLTSKELT